MAVFQNLVMILARSYHGHHDHVPSWQGYKASCEAYQEFSKRHTMHTVIRCTEWWPVILYAIYVNSYIKDYQYYSIVCLWLLWSNIITHSYNIFQEFCGEFCKSCKKLHLKFCKHLFKQLNFRHLSWKPQLEKIFFQTQIFHLSSTQPNYHVVLFEDNQLFRRKFG